MFGNGRNFPWQGGNPIPPQGVAGMSANPYANLSPNFNSFQGLSKSVISNYLKQYVFGQDVNIVWVEDTADSAKHICRGSKVISVLPLQNFQIRTLEGNFNQPGFFCSNCKKLILSRL